MEKKRQGARSTVVQGKNRGGMITCRMSRPLHKKFAEICEKENLAMNAILVECIKQFVAEREPKDAESVPAETVQETVIPTATIGPSVTEQQPTTDQEQEGLRSEVSER